MIKNPNQATESEKIAEAMRVIRFYLDAVDSLRLCIAKEKGSILKSTQVAIDRKDNSETINVS